MFRREFATGVLISAAAGFGCKTVTTVTPASDNAVGAGSFEHIAVMGVFQRPQTREAFEKGVVAAFEAKSVRAISSLELMQGPGPYDEEAIRAAVEAHGIDAAIVARLAEVEVDTEVRAGTGGGTVGGFYAFYNDTAMGVRDFTTEKYLVDTHFFRVSDRQEVWTARSETIDPENRDDGIMSYATAMVDAIISAGLTTNGQ